MKISKIFSMFTACVTGLSFFAASGCGKNGPSSPTGDSDIPPSATELLSYSFNEDSGNVTKETVGGENYKIQYVFNAENQANLFKPASDPLRRTGVSGNALYMDGFSTHIKNWDFTLSSSAFTLSAWVAPRVFENLPYYDGESAAAGNPRLTSVINKGDIEMGEGFLLGYGRLGLWGVQLALYNAETDEEFVAAFYDPINALPLYEWSHITASFDGETGYIALFYNGVCAYESIIPELAGTSVVSSEEPLYIGRYANPVVEFGIKRQMPSGLLDEVNVYGYSLSPAKVKALYREGTKNGEHPALAWEDIALDSSVYEGDRYRPQYHALPPAVWMNEPHSPFYYKGKYHVFYQHNPSGPYWSQIRWGHLVSDDMIHWTYVKDAVVPTKGVCPEGVWTGGACIGPDGTPWLAITAGTNTSTWSGQNMAFAHPVDPDDPYLTDWVVEDKVTITQPNNDSQGERDQFRDPFLWYDDGVYYMLISTSVPNAGGSANIYTSTDMRNWEYKGYLFECDYNRYPVQGAHWECVVMFPISTVDGSQTKYILFDCPQYTVDGYTVDCYYWIGDFDKTTCRFIPDDPQNPEPLLFDYGRGVFTGQNGYCFLTDEDVAAGKTSYEQGRTVIYAIAQGKDAGTEQNYNAGWAHNFAIPLELHLSDDGKSVIREPIKETESLRRETLYEYKAVNEGEGKTAAQINEEISSLRGDLLEIDLAFTIAPGSPTYKGGLSVRYNPTQNNLGTERTHIVFGNEGVYIDRTQSSLYDYVAKQPTYTWGNTGREYTVKILLDRSMLEVYVNGVASFTTRIYPKYGDSDYLRLFDEGAGMKVTKLTIRRLGSAFSERVTPAYYENTGNLSDAGV